MLERHRSQNEAWLRARAEENDRERRELCRLQVSKQTNKQTCLFSQCAVHNTLMLLLTVDQT